MFLTLFNLELCSTIYLCRRKFVGLPDKFLPSFPDLIEPLHWDLLGLTTDTAFMCRSPPTVLFYVTITTQLKQVKTAFPSATVNLCKFDHLLAVRPNLLHPKGAQ